eukprot:scaffold129050_cov35-Tisochrysis_lutea.AAC.2
MDRGVDCIARAKEADENGGDVLPWWDGRAVDGLESLKDVEQLSIETLGFQNVHVANFLLQGTVEGQHKVAKHNRIRQSHHYGDGTEGPLHASRHEACSDGTFSDAPKQLLGDWRLGEAGRRLQIIHVGAGIRRCDKVDDRTDVQHHLQEACDQTVRLDNPIDLQVGVRLAHAPRRYVDERRLRAKGWETAVPVVHGGGGRQHVGIGANGSIRNEAFRNNAAWDARGVRILNCKVDRGVGLRRAHALGDQGGDTLRDDSHGDDAGAARVWSVAAIHRRGERSDASVGEFLEKIARVRAPKQIFVVAR